MPATDDLLALTRDDLDRWQQSILHLSVRYRSGFISQVGCFYRWAHDEGLIKDNPARVLVRPRVPRGLPHPISEDDLAVAISCAPQDVRAMLVLAAYEGLRAGEIARLSREDIRDNDDPPILIVHGKGGKVRAVPLSQHVAMELYALRLPSRGFVFRRRDGKPGGMPPHRVSQICNHYLHALGITESLHSLRHRFATVGYRHTLDLRAVQEVMGHASPITTAGYAAFTNLAGQAVVAAAATTRTAAQPV